MKIKCEVCKQEAHKRKGAKYCSNNCKLVAWASRHKKTLTSKSKSSKV